MQRPGWQRAIEQQKRSNINALQHYERFAPHRRRLTDVVLAEAVSAAESSPSGPRLCVLGAGNCGDLDLPALLRRYGSIDLVDVDEQAVSGAIARQDPSTRHRLVRHAPIDLSGLLEPFERWRDLQVTLDEVLQHPFVASERIATKVSAPYDVVLSACVLSQLHFAALEIFSDTHPLFAAVSHTLTLTHLKTLARLTKPGGVALLVSDVASGEMLSASRARELGDPRVLLAHQLRTGEVFTAVRPDLVAGIAADDPSLQRELEAARLVDVWFWQNGPRRSFLVYALAFPRNQRR